MKRCPQCNRVENDDTLVFCRADGTPLVSDSGSDNADAGTARFGSSPVASELETSVLPQHATDADMSRATGPTTVLDRQRAIGGTRELGSAKRSNLWVLTVAVVLIAAIAVSAYFYLSRKNNAAIQSVAVLPFVNASGNTDVEYLSDGITESLINNLSQLPNLSVKARSTVFHYKGKDVTPQQVGSELAVQAVLNGRVVQRGDQLTLSLELVDSGTGNQIWGEQYNRKTADLVSLQSEIARDVSNKLRLKLSGADEQKLAKQHTADPEAYELYLKGRYFWNRRTPDDFKKAIVYFQQAIQKDPNYSLAYSGLSDAYNLLSVYGANLPRETMPQAKEAAARALSLDNNLAEAHASMGQYLMNYQFDWSGAEREFRRAIELNPNYATARQWLGEVLAIVGRPDESLIEARRSMELDPLSLVINLVYGNDLLFARRYDEAIVQYKKTIDLNPDWPEAHKWIFFVYVAKEMYGEAVAEYVKGQTLSGETPTEIRAMQESFAKSGWYGFLQHRADYLSEKSKRQYVATDDIADVYAQLGDRDKAFAWLERAHQERQQGLSYLKVAAKFDNLRSDPRFEDLMRRVGLAQ